MTHVDFHAEPKRSDKNRTVAFEWEAGDGVDFAGRPVKLVAELSAMHDKDRKQFFAHLRMVGITEPEPGYTIRSTSLMDFLSVLVEPVGRFSAKALEAFAAEALDRLRYHAESDAVLAVVASADKVAA